MRSDGSTYLADRDWLRVVGAFVAPPSVDHVTPELVRGLLVGLLRQHCFDADAKELAAREACKVVDLAEVRSRRGYGDVVLQRVHGDWTKHWTTSEPTMRDALTCPPSPTAAGRVRPKKYGGRVNAHRKTAQRPTKDGRRRPPVPRPVEFTGAIEISAQQHGADLSLVEVAALNGLANRVLAMLRLLELSLPDVELVELVRHSVRRAPKHYLEEPCVRSWFQLALNNVQFWHVLRAHQPLLRLVDVSEAAQ